MSIFDTQSLLEPINDTQPSGLDQTATSQYLQIIEAMREDDPNLTRQDWEELKVADWGKVQSLCDTLLSTKTKDMQLVMWMIEAGLRKEGIAALSEGFTLLANIIDTFWESLHPMMEEPNELYRRMNVINKFFNKFEDKSRFIIISKPDSSENQPYTWGNYLECSYIDKLPESDKKEATANGRPTTFMFNSSVQNTSTEFYLEFKDLTQQVIDSIHNLELILQTKLELLIESLDDKGDADYSFSQTIETLELIQKWVNRILSERGVGGSVDSDETTIDTSGNVIVQRGGTGTDINAINSREEAYNAINRISDYLMRIEPHSPVPYLLKRAAKWGRMSAQDLLEELYNNATDIKQLFKLLDVNQEEQGSSQSGSNTSSDW